MEHARDPAACSPLRGFQETCAKQYRLLCALMMMFTTHAPACSDGKDPLDLAIDGTRHDTIAFLRSLPLFGVGTPDNGLLESAM
jgi:hypothetical protein